MSDVELRAHDRHGAFLDVIPRRRQVRWTDRLNIPGDGQFDIRLDDARLTPALLDYHNIVKVRVDGTDRAAFRVEQRNSKVVDQGEYAGRWLTVSGRDLSSLLDAGVIYPEAGLLTTSGDMRPFNYASKQGAWYNSADWAPPLGVIYPSDPTVRRNATVSWTDTGAYWIWPAPDGPTTPVAPGATAFFRASLTVGTGTAARISATADNEFELYVDGELVLTSDPTRQFVWQQTNTYDLTLSAGTHLIAAKVVNGQHGGTSSVAGFLFSMSSVDDQGNPLAVLLHSDTTHWLATTANVGWRAAQILKTLVSEAQTRAVSALAIALLTLGFTDTQDSNGSSWTDVQDIELPVAMQSILDVTPQLCEIGPIDVAVTPALVLNAYKSRGTDRTTGANPIRLLPIRSLLEHAVSGQADLQTRLLVRSGTGWSEVADATAESTYGRWEGGMQLGNTTSSGQTSAAGDAGIGILANPQIAYTSRGYYNGPIPYVDFDLGDRVQTVDETGALVAVTVAGLTFSEDDGGVLTYVPELRP